MSKDYTEEEEGGLKQDELQRYNGVDIHFMQVFPLGGLGVSVYKMMRAFIHFLLELQK